MPSNEDFETKTANECRDHLEHSLFGSWK